jgi:hemoglobin/transferrin/lactoferrin receptor protein
MKLLLTCLCVWIGNLTYAQSIHGRVTDQNTKEPIADVHIQFVNSSTGTITDKEGKFVLERFNGLTQIRISSIGYATIEQTLSADDQELQIGLTPSVILLNNGLTITAQRNEHLTFDVPESITTVSSLQLEQQAPRSTPEALMNETGIWIQKTNHGGGSPIIRGLVGNQVLLLVDGIRLNNATYRYGPNQYLSTIDPGLIERIEATRGSGSVLYGSDALGGVVQVISKTPTFRSDGFHAGGRATGKWMSAGMEQSARAEVDLGGKQVAFLGGFSARNFGDILAGGDLGMLVPTGYYERSGDAKLLVRTGGTGILTTTFQHLTQHDVPRYDQVTQGGYSLYNFEPQTRQLSYVRWEHSSDSRWLQSFRVTGSLNRSIEGIHSQKNNSPEIKKQLDEVNTLGMITEVISNPKQNWHVQSGIEYYFDKVNSDAMAINTITNEETTQRGSYADGSTSSSLAVFTNHQIDWKKFQFSAGTRFNMVTVSIIDNVFGNQKINPDALVGNAGVMYKLHNNLHAIASINTGFRAPNIDDMSKFGTLEANVFEIPSEQLSPERSINIEGGFKFSSSKVSATATVYQTKLSDLIDRVGVSYNGSDTFEGRKVYQKQNVGDALIKGIEADIEAMIVRSLNVFGNVTYTHGENITKQEPMRRIPPLFGRTGIRYKHSSGVWMKVEWAMAGEQDRLAAGDKSDARIKIRLVDEVMPAWDIINVYAGYSYKFFSIQVYGQNLLNKAYRVYASGVDGYGRSAGASIGLKF